MECFIHPHPLSPWFWCFGAHFRSYPIPWRAKQHLVQGQRYTGQRGPCWPLACLIRGQKRPLECGCTLESVAESPCAGALGRLAALFPTVELLCSSTQARPSCLRPQGCTNSTAGQRLCIFKQLLKGHFHWGGARRLGNLCKKVGSQIESKATMISTGIAKGLIFYLCNTSSERKTSFLTFTFFFFFFTYVGLIFFF